MLFCIQLDNLDHDLDNKGGNDDKEASRGNQNEKIPGES